MATIKVIIDKKGQASIDVDGVEGQSCTDLTNVLVSNLGEVENVDEKPQYFNEIDSIEQELWESEEE